MTTQIYGKEEIYQKKVPESFYIFVFLCFFIVKYGCCVVFVLYILVLSYCLLLYALSHVLIFPVYLKSYSLNIFCFYIKQYCFIHICEVRWKDASGG